MLKRLRCHATVILLALLLASPKTVWGQIIDQQMTALEPQVGMNINECCAFIAQTFTAGLTGTLAGVSIDVHPIFGSTLPPHVAIRTVQAGVPTNIVLTEITLNSSSVSLGALITFPVNIPLQAGQQYAIVVNYVGAPPPGGGHGQGIWHGVANNPYPGGAALASVDGTSWQGVGFDADGRFQTYMFAGQVQCQVNPAKTFPQYANPPTYLFQPVMQYPPLMLETPVPQYFGFLPSPNSVGYVLCPMIESGCALASAATMLTSFSSLASVTPTLLDCELRGDCASPNRYATGSILLCPESSPTCTKSQANVSYPDWCEFDRAWSGLEYVYPNVVQWVGGSQAQQSELFDSYQNLSVPVSQYLDNYVCAHQDRVILQLNEYDDGTFAGQHYVFVTGQSADGSDWNVFDPGWRNAAPTLAGHEAGFTTCNAAGTCTFRRFTVGGARTYKDVTSSGNAGAFSATANSPIELQVVDAQGRRLGNANGTDVFEIPNGSYIRDFPFADDAETGMANGDPTGIKTAHVPSPLTGAYQVMATGTGLGAYTLKIESLATDGTVQSTSLTGVTNAGSTSTYQLSYSPMPGGSGSVTLLATFQSTFADVSNCLALHLIDNAGIANALLSKITAASNAAASVNSKTARNILGAFVNQIDAQTGKHINGIAAQVLLADAQSLIAQLSD